MAREVTHTAREPRIIDAEDIHEEKGDIAICLCGLSATTPFCDGSHKAAQDERADRRYRYHREDGELVREVISEGDGEVDCPSE